MRNHLHNEKSPYLLQHVNNPVDWYPWSDEAFRIAEKKQKPIFLSIGYSTCHWCHVMAHESFEDTQVATLLNDTFVCIKVDREERPDIDKTYMTVCQLITARGGWPLTIMMTPDKQPFFAATYIPKESRFGMKGLLQIIPEVKRLWQQNQTKLTQSARDITTQLQKISLGAGNQKLNQTTLDAGYDQLLRSYDELYGGFGQQPKFPTPHTLLFLLRYHKRTQQSFAKKMAEYTLQQMRHGGMYDHIGGGFHRYSTDRKWIIPHFEKMLYDQALLLMAYTEAYQATRKPLFKKTAQEIIEYVHGTMTSEKGGFFAAEDADSEGAEGKYYTWEYEKLKHILTDAELAFVTQFYNIQKEGNFTSETDPSAQQNIFYQTMSIDDYAAYASVQKEDVIQTIETIQKKLYQNRSQRSPPGKDDKILTDWNGLMIAALSKASRIFNRKKYTQYAENAADFILHTMLQKDNQLLHRHRDGDTNITGFADDYAFLIWGLLELYQTTFKTKYLSISHKLTSYLLNHFWDDTQGGLYFTSDTSETILTRTKEIYDGAIPSANSVAFYTLLQLARITGDSDLELKAQDIGTTFSTQVTNTPQVYTQLLIGLDYALGPSYEIVIVGDKENNDTQKILQSIQKMYLPTAIILLKEPSSKDDRLEKLVPFLKDYSQLHHQPTIYVCQNQHCQRPTTSIKEMKQLLS